MILTMEWNMGQRGSSIRGRLFVTQGLDGIQVRRLPGGVDPKHQSNSCSGAQAKHYPEYRQVGRKRRPHFRNQPGKPSSDQHSDYTADGGEVDSLQRKLQENIWLARSNRFSHADLAGPLG